MNRWTHNKEWNLKTERKKLPKKINDTEVIYRKLSSHVSMVNWKKSSHASVIKGQKYFEIFLVFKVERSFKTITNVE